MRVTLVFDELDCLLGVFKSHDESLKAFNADGVYRTERPILDLDNGSIVVTREQIQTALYDLYNTDRPVHQDIYNILDELFGGTSK